MATPSALPARVRAIVENGGVVPSGVIPLSQTIFLWQSAVSVIVEIAIVTMLIWWLTPRGEHVRTAADLGIPIDDEPAPVDPKPRTPGEWLEHQPWLSVAIVALGFVFVARELSHGITALSLNLINLTLLLLALLLHRTPARLMRAFARATPAVWGVILQFPFYAGIAAMIAATSLNETLAGAFVRISTRTTFPALMAIYSAILGLFIPSGGGKWLVEAPYVMRAAHDLKVHLGWVVASYDLGEALANLIQPFWMLPVLALLGLRARDVMGYTFAVFVVLVPVVLVLVTVLGMTLPYPN
jgi:short-chain fatty acids transporter